MAYEKISPTEWIEKLQEGKFKDITSARKSMGKTSWPLAIRERVAILAERHCAGRALSPQDISKAVDMTTLPEAKRAPAPAAKRTPAKKRTPAQEQPPAPVLAPPVHHKGAGTEVDVDPRGSRYVVGPYEDLKAVIEVAHQALLAYRTVHDIAPNITMSEELDSCIGMIEACVRELGERVPKSLKREAAKLREEAAKTKELGPKALTVAVPPSGSGMPLESNEAGADLWRRTKPSRPPSNGGA